MERGRHIMKHVQPATVTIAACALLAVVVLASPVIEAADTAPAAAAPRVRPSAAQNTYASPEEAAKALADAIRADDRKQIWRVLGPGASKFVRSGDPVQDNDARVAFVAAYDRSVKFERAGDTKATLVIGADDFPFPYPLVKKNERWQFDAKQGNEQVLDRRIGRNELAAIQVALAFTDAQNEYRQNDWNGDGVLEYAMRGLSTPGRRDGLYWASLPGEPESPLGAEFADAKVGQPYHGYLYKILTAQGANAPGGAKSYIKNGHMTEGYALVAWPAKFDDTGVMTFIVNQDGIVYEKSLGPNTEAIARAMKAYDPDASWQKAQTAK